MSDLHKQVMDAIDTQGKMTHELREEVKKLNSADYVDRDSFKKMEEAMVKADNARAELEKKYNSEVAELKKIAEEASLKAGRRGGAGADADDGTSAEDIEHKTAFIAHIRNRRDNHVFQAMREAEKKTVQIASGGDGGFAVPKIISSQIQSKVADTSVMEKLVNSVTVGTSAYQELVDKGGMGYAWVGENDQRPATDTPQIYAVDFPMGTVYAYPQATEEALEDVFFNIEDWLVKSAQTAFANACDIEIIKGTGLKKPCGMLENAPVSEADGTRASGVFQFIGSGDAATIAYPAQLIATVHALKARYRTNASWLMNDLTTAAIRTLIDNNGRFLWSDSLIVGQPNTLLGYAVNSVDAMPDIGPGSVSIGFGDWKRAYTMVNGFDIRVTKDEITAPGFVKWHIRKRLGGAVTNDDAGKFIKCAVL